MSTSWTNLAGPSATHGNYPKLPSSKDNHRSEDYTLGETRIVEREGHGQMSLTVSRGLTDAGRWTAVATAVAEYLDEFDAAVTKRTQLPSPPGGAIRAAERFFELGLRGIAVDEAPRRRKGRNGHSPERDVPPPPTMAGISNLTIARRVMQSSRLHADVSGPDDSAEMRRQITSLLTTLKSLAGEPRPTVARRDRLRVAKFFHELRRHGEAERDAALAAQERPGGPSVS